MAPSDRRFDLVFPARKPDIQLWTRLYVDPYLPVASGAKGRDFRRLPLRLDRAMGIRWKNRPEVVCLGGRSEPYPPAERKERVVRLLLEVIARRGGSAVIQTGSSLILRDIDLIREISEETSAAVIFIPPAEFYRSSRRRRDLTGVIERIRHSGVQTGVQLDLEVKGNEEELTKVRTLFAFASKLNLDFVHPSAFPQSNPYNRNLLRLVFDQSLHYGVGLAPKRYCPADYRRENFWLASLLSAEALDRRLRGDSFRPFETAARRIDSLKQDLRLLLAADKEEFFAQLPQQTHGFVRSLLSGGEPRVGRRQ